MIAVPLSLLTAEVFGRLVEQPSHRLAKRIGRLAESASEAATESPQAKDFTALDDSPT